MRFIDSDQANQALTPDSVLVGLDADQRAAVTAPVGIVVVRAGAGSGKTTVLTRRIAWRALNDTADIERTLAITFTRQAATEMRARLAQFDLEGRPTIGTFHAVARRIMLQHYEDKGRRAPVIINNRSSVMSMCMGDDARRGGVNDVLNAVDWAHSRMLGPADAAKALVAAGQNLPLGEKRFTEIFDAYEKAKKKRGAVDLNDFLTYVVNEAAKDPRYAESIRFQYRHISVDEAQDMNPLQYAFLKVVTANQPDLFLVGDPNQAIYGFNGADKTLFDTLPNMNGAAHVVSLPSNYRCTPEIVRMAVSTLATDGQIADAESKRSMGSPVLLQRCSSETDESAFITKSVLRAKSGRSWNDIAVLVRVNAVADEVREALSKVGIPIRSSRRGGAWARAVASATDLTGRESLTAWAADILDTGEYQPEDVDYMVAILVRQFLDDNRVGSVDGRTFGSWLATSADLAESDGVEVLTFHAAKGREWSYVIVAGTEKGLLPHRGARGPVARSEEARLAYVALTRAADELVVTWTDSRNGKTSGPSPFLPTVTTEIPTFDPPPEELRRRARAHTTGNPVQNAIEEWRKDTARHARVEPHAILSTRSIRMMMRDVPTSIEDIARLSDPMFARRHGQALLEVITQASER